MKSSLHSNLSPCVGFDKKPKVEDLFVPELYSAYPGIYNSSHMDTPPPPQTSTSTPLLNHLHNHAHHRTLATPPSLSRGPGPRCRINNNNDSIFPGQMDNSDDDDDNHEIHKNEIDDANETRSYHGNEVTDYSGYAEEGFREDGVKFVPTKSSGAGKETILEGPSVFGLNEECLIVDDASVSRAHGAGDGGVEHSTGAMPSSGVGGALSAVTDRLKAELNSRAKTSENLLGETANGTCENLQDDNFADHSQIMTPEEKIKFEVSRNLKFL